MKKRSPNQGGQVIRMVVNRESTDVVLI